MPTNEETGFSADLDRMDQAIRQYLEPAVTHFQQVSTAVASITEHDPQRLFGSSFSDVPLSMAYEVARDSVVDGEREAARSLTAFHDTLVEVVRTYRAVDEASAENLRRAGLTS